MTGLRDRLHGGGDAGGRPTDHRLRKAVDVGDDDIAFERIDDRLYFVDRRQDRCHQPVVVERHVGHTPASEADRFERLAKTEGSGGDQGAVLAEAVPHHHVRSDVVGGEQTCERQVYGEHGGLRDRRLPERVVCSGHGIFIARVDKDDLAEWLAEERLHHLVGFAERISDDRLHLAQLTEHVDIL